MARITRNKTQHAKNFSLKDYGSWSKAEAAAAKWVKQIKTELPPPIAPKDRMSTRNSSGVVGVALKTSTKQVPTGEYTHYSWVSFWPGNASGTRWGVDKYGEKDAFVHAVLSRRMECRDRRKVIKAFEQIKGQREYRDILKHKSLELV